MLNNRKITFFSFLFLFIISCIYSNQILVEAQTPSNSYKIVIDDKADLLTDKEEKDLFEIMKPITEYGHVSFITNPIDSFDSTSTSHRAASIYKSLFSNDSGTLFLIDMDNREIYIFSDGEIYKTITDGKAIEITDKIYRYASEEKYFACAEQAFTYECQLLHQQTFYSPLRYITSIIIGVSLSLIVSILIVCHQRNLNMKIRDVSQNTETFFINRTIDLVSHTRHISSSSSSGGGGHSRGGGSSGGGGGHSF